MNSRTGVKLAAMVLGLVAFGILVAAVVGSIHGGGTCDRGDGASYGFCGGDPAFFAIEALAYGAGIGFTAGALSLLMYLRWTGPNPPR